MWSSNHLVPQSQSSFPPLDTYGGISTIHTNVLYFARHPPTQPPAPTPPHARTPHPTFTTTRLTQTRLRGLSPHTHSRGCHSAGALLGPRVVSPFSLVGPDRTPLTIRHTNITHITSCTGVILPHTLWTMFPFGRFAGSLRGSGRRFVVVGRGGRAPSVESAAPAAAVRAAPEHVLVQMR